MEVYETISFRFGNTGQHEMWSHHKRLTGFPRTVLAAYALLVVFFVQATSSWFTICSVA